MGPHEEGLLPMGLPQAWRSSVLAERYTSHIYTKPSTTQWTCNNVHYNIVEKHSGMDVGGKMLDFEAPTNISYWKT